MKLGTGEARTRHDRLEIAGQQSLSFPETTDAYGLKVLLEEGASGIGILRPDPRSLAADVRQRPGKLFASIAASRFEEGLAAGLIGCVGRELIISRPARELAPFDRLELAVSELQRPFGESGRGRKTYHHADEDGRAPSP